MIDIEIALLRQLLNIAQRERIAKIPPDRTRVMPGSVCRHLKIAGRVIISRLFHSTSQQPRKLQHIPRTFYWACSRHKCAPGEAGFEVAQRASLHRAYFCNRRTSFATHFNLEERESGRDMFILFAAICTGLPFSAW